MAMVLKGHRADGRTQPKPRGRAHATVSKTIDRHIGARVRARRIALGLTQQRLAALAGVSYQQVQKYEHGANRIACSMLLRLARALAVPPEHFFADVRPSTWQAAPGAAGSALARLGEREALELIKAYGGVADPRVRKAARQLLVTFAKWRKPAPPRRRRGAWDASPDRASSP